MIYLLGTLEYRVAKIGSTDNIKQRISSLQTSCPFDLELIASRDGDCALERQIHQAAKHLHKAREWFHLSDELVALFKQSYADPVFQNTHRDIIKAVGHAVIADATSRPITTVRSWDMRNSIPSSEWPVFVGKGWATADALLKTQPVKKPSRATA